MALVLSVVTINNAASGAIHFHFIVALLLATVIEGVEELLFDCEIVAPILQVTSDYGISQILYK
jgi:hypothetical protein